MLKLTLTKIVKCFWSIQKYWIKFINLVTLYNKLSFVDINALSNMN